MNLKQALTERRSVRNFQKKEPDKKTIKELIAAATMAPSACNIQGWKFIIVDNEKIKEKIFEAGGSIVIKNSPIGILVLYHNQTTNYEYQDDVQSASAAIQNLLLKATELGLGSCWICHLPTKKYLRKIFNIPTCYSPIAYILLGYQKFQPIDIPRKYRLSEIMNYNTFSPEWQYEKEKLIKLKRTLIKIYSITPNIIKNKFLNDFVDKKFVKKFKN